MCRFWYLRHPMANSSKKSETRVPGWVWLITGVLLGALITLLMRLSELKPATTPSKKPQTSQSAKQDDSSVKFKFYDLLRDNEIVVPDKPKTTTKPVDENVEYLLQVASFKSYEDADQARAELILLNLKPRIEKADVGKGQTWHRVIVGPYQSRSELAKARDTLLSNRFEALVLKRKKT